ncbi:GNAT family N-acetyltransferase [Achromobacter sp. DH1f]|uniref:GNAT family N-acetyltransferase n=1 Tax=Achromobacter sp. DH1f TaxID=1397275 RepID=UPI0009DD166A|nr:GNAT family N-acetyltransferase [Achromobacter sp. DH1f]
MEYVFDVSCSDLSDLQSSLQRENSSQFSGISDIWANIHPFYVAVKNSDVIVGVCSLSYQEGANSAEIFKLYVVPEFRGRGVARALIKEVVKFLKRNNVDEIFVEVIDESQDFWEKILVELEHKHWFENKYSLVI